jgi:tol-pal system protein YbgF
MRYFYLLIATLMLAGCLAPTEDQIRMQSDLEELKRRLADLEVSSVEASQAETVGSTTLERQVAELVAGLDNMRVEFQGVNGRIDDLGYNNQGVEDELQLIKDDLGMQLVSLSNRVDELEQKSEAAAVAAPEQQVAIPAPVVESPEDLYSSALDLIRNQKRFADGRVKLEMFVGKYPEHDLYVNALYWAGEALYGEKKYELAILQLQDVISKFPTHPKAPAALLKQGLSFNAMGDAANARTTMLKLVEEYPDSSQAASAKEYLN